MDPHALRILMALEHDLSHDAFLASGRTPSPADYGAPTPAGRALDRLLDAAGAPPRTRPSPGSTRRRCARVWTPTRRPPGGCAAC